MLPLSFHYYLWNTIMGFPVSFAHLTVPKTATVLESVSAGSSVPTSWHTIESGQTVEYVAHERIILQPGFKVEAGARFSARIEPCWECENNRSMLSTASSTEEETNESELEIK